MGEMICAGQRFLPNGDLLIAWHRPRNRMLVQVRGFRHGELVLVDSWVEPTCPACGAPFGTHASICKLRK